MGLPAVPAAAQGRRLRGLRAFAAEGPHEMERTGMSNTALTKFDYGAIASKPLDTIDQFRTFCEEMKGRAIVLTPVAHIDHIPNIFQISRRIVTIDPTVPGPNKNGPECYHASLFCGPNEVALGHVGLTKILAAAGASPIESVRTDSRSDPYLCEMRVVLAIQDFDGLWRQMPGTEEIDLRDGSPAAKSMGPAQLNQARRKILRNCESRAMNAGIRQLLSIQHKYPVADLLRMPFVVPKLIPRVDHPEVRAAMIQGIAGPATRALYGGGHVEDAHIVKDVTPRGEDIPDTPAPRQQPGPTVETPDSAPARDGGDQLDLLDLVLCGCPCSCQAEVEDHVAKSTTEAFGSIRCPACAPGKAFDYGRHKDLKTLGLAKRPNLTADDVKRMLDAKAAPAGRR
jgi:hypothetical protein